MGVDGSMGGGVDECLGLVVMDDPASFSGIETMSLLAQNVGMSMISDRSASSVGVISSVICGNKSSLNVQSCGARM